VDREGIVIIGIEAYLLFSDKDITLKTSAPLTCKGSLV